MASQPMMHHISILTEIKIAIAWVNVCEGIKQGFTLHGYSYDQLIGWVDLDLGSSPGWWPIL